MVEGRAGTLVLLITRVGMVSDAGERSVERRSRLPPSAVAMPSQVVTLDSLSWHDSPPHDEFTLDVPDALTRDRAFRNRAMRMTTREQTARCETARV